MKWLIAAALLAATPASAHPQRPLTQTEAPVEVRYDRFTEKTTIETYPLKVGGGFYSLVATHKKRADLRYYLVFVPSMRARLYEAYILGDTTPIPVSGKKGKSHSMAIPMQLHDPDVLEKLGGELTVSFRGDRRITFTIEADELQKFLKAVDASALTTSANDESGSHLDWTQSKIDSVPEACKEMMELIELRVGEGVSPDQYHGWVQDCIDDYERH